MQKINTLSNLSWLELVGCLIHNYLIKYYEILNMDFHLESWICLN
jgi:hypothetical protein